MEFEDIIDSKDTEDEFWEAFENLNISQRSRILNEAKVRGFAVDFLNGELILWLQNQYLLKNDQSLIKMLRTFLQIYFCQKKYSKNV